MTYFSRAILDASDSHANYLLQQVAHNAYREHQLIWKLFPNDGDASRDFIYRSQHKHLNRVYYLVSSKKPENIDGWKIDSKLYSPNILEGTRLAFSLRVNPIVKRKDSSGRSCRHDVVMDAKKTMGYKKLNLSQRDPMNELIQETGVKWLKSRGERNGFQFDDCSITIESYDQHKTYKAGGKHSIQYTTMDITGILKVNNAANFVTALIKGIGPAKAFGCGLMLVKRI